MAGKPPAYTFVRAHNDMEDRSSRLRWPPLRAPAHRSHARCYSPFEVTAHEFNSAEVNGESISEELWKAFDAGVNAKIQADLAEYSNSDYGIEDDE